MFSQRFTAFLPVSHSFNMTRHRQRHQHHRGRGAKVQRFGLAVQRDGDDAAAACEDVRFQATRLIAEQHGFRSLDRRLVRQYCGQAFRLAFFGAVSSAAQTPYYGRLSVKNSSCSWRVPADGLGACGGADDLGVQHVHAVVHRYGTSQPAAIGRHGSQCRRCPGRAHLPRRRSAGPAVLAKFDVSFGMHGLGIADGHDAAVRTDAVRRRCSSAHKSWHPARFRRSSPTWRR